MAHRHLAALICVAALALRILIPTGYMISVDQGRVAVTLCSGVAQQLPSMTMDMPGMDHTMPDHGKSKDHGKAEMPCAFSSLSAQVLGAVDPSLLVAALAFVAALALHSLSQAIIREAPYLRPHLRGPPPAV
ncbi:DUF2946 family protein [Sphingomonas sp. Leaf37]|uniref:DUF2946 family protein n=1 Tax=Sphingomonas sp. Leaf37 TaxID=2876552 RepID=UPI001E418C84|nr:DUF2946 family protein [Sphingomonas sp. Leaf37]